MKGIVMDLRQNPGGYLDAALEISIYSLQKVSRLFKYKKRRGASYQNAIGGKNIIYQ